MRNSKGTTGHFKRDQWGSKGASTVHRESMKPLRLESLAYAHCDPGDHDDEDPNQQSFNRAVAVVRRKAEVSFDEVQHFPVPAITPLV